MTALPKRIRRFEVRFRQTETGAPQLPPALGRDFFDREEPEPEETMETNNAAVDRCEQEHRFVRQPVKILLVPRHRLVR